MMVRFLACVLICTMGFARLSFAAIWFVDAAATGLNNGHTWEDAFVDFQDALEAAQQGDEVWIAAGIYRPDRGTDDRSMSFSLTCGVAYYGGFSGWETMVWQRDWVRSPTILSGDLNDDDGPRNCDHVSNCCYEHDGFGCDNPQCAELVCSQDVGQQQGCCEQFLGHENWNQDCANAARNICCELGDGNRCDNSVVVVRVNKCQMGVLLNGLIFEHSYRTVRDRDIWLPDGGGLYAEDAFIIVSNCIFRENQSAGIYLESTISSLDGCFFFDNAVGLYGSGNANFVDCEFRGNKIGSQFYGPSSYFDCLATENEYWGLYCSGGQTTIGNCLITENGRQGIYTRSLVNITNTIVADNNVGGLFSIDGPVIARNSRFSRNRNQPAIYISSASGLFENCLFDNGTDQGFNSVANISDSPVEFRNCTFAQNLGRDHPSVISNSSVFAPSPVTLSNCIFWMGDEYKIAPDALLKTYFFPDASFAVDHSIIQGWTGALGGEGNSGASPQFLDPDGADNIPGNEDDDFRLASGSPAIDAGNSSVPNLPSTDLDGHARVLCGAVDMGAYEFGAGDFNCDQTVDLSDQSAWPDCMTDPASSSLSNRTFDTWNLPPDSRFSWQSKIENRQSQMGNGCEAFDFNADSDIDLADFASLQRVLVSP